MKRELTESLKAHKKVLSAVKKSFKAGHTASDAYKRSANKYAIALSLEIERAEDLLELNFKSMMNSIDTRSAIKANMAFQIELKTEFSEVIGMDYDSWIAIQTAA